MNKKRKDIIANNEISELLTLELGGYQQKVLIEGKTKELPIVVFLHGGPGNPVPFSVGCRGLFPEFTDRFIMVYWDQLGCGINNHVIDERFTIDTFVGMTEDLLREIKRLFPDNKLHIFATSWGSVLSAKVLEKTKDIVDGVVVSGQVIKELFINQEVIKELEKSQITTKKLDIIKNIKIDEFVPEELQLVSSSIRKYTQGYDNKNGEAAPVGGIIWGLLTSPDYRFKDFKAIMVNGYYKNVTLWKELLALDVSDTLKNVSVPYVMLQGDTDIVASTKVAKELADNANNPCLQCRVIENAGHYPNVAVMNAVMEALVSQVYGEK